MAELFGFEIKRKNEKKAQENKKSFVPPMEDDGAGVIKAGGHFGQYVDLSGGQAKNENDLIKKYREVAQHPEVDAAIEDIVNEAVVIDDEGIVVDLGLDQLEQPDRIKKIIREEFDNILSILNFNNYGHETFRRWYVDGRMYFHIVINEKSPKKGIQELRPIDPTRIRKVKEVLEEVDPKTGAKVIKGIEEYYIYQDNNLNKSGQGLKISKDSIIYVTSGLLSPAKDRVISYLDKAMKPANQLRMMEDALVIYRMSRAPERRVFYIDVGNLPKGKAEEYLNSVMSKYRNKIVYDAQTGEIGDDRRNMSMLEDFWLPRREGGRGTEISTLPGGENLGQIDDIIYFQKKLYRSLNVPLNRLEQEAQFSLGRTSEITRDEVKFSRFVSKLRNKFSDVFYQALKIQLMLKGICTLDDWEWMRPDINVNFKQESYFSELKEAEILRERVNTLRELDEYVGKYYSVEFVRRNILMQTDEEMEEIDKQIEDEKDKYDDDDMMESVQEVSPIEKEHIVESTELDLDEDLRQEELHDSQLELMKSMTHFFEKD
jgi:hypothetical protein